MRYFILALLLWSCGSANHEPVASDRKAPVPPSAKQINLTILLDLSDRIDPVANPGHVERDSALISYFSSYFLGQMATKGTYMSKGKMRLIFSPNPPDPGINMAAQVLNIDLSKMDTKEKKKVYETLGVTVAENISRIYRTAIGQGKWPGSDIWRFFKNDVKDVAVDKDTSYRNILVVFTDGYIYHDDSQDKDRNRYAYILPKLFDKYKLRGNNGWAEKMDKDDFGLISKRADLEALEVLMLEVTPSPKFKNDEDVIRKVMEKWLGEMKVKRWGIFNSDLPERTKQKVEGFLGA
jgi:hypothetical protein